MSEKFPYFHYDIVARVIPAAMLLAVAWLCGAPLPNPVKDTDAAGLLDSAVLGMIYLGACYAIGVCMETIQRIRPIDEWCESRSDDAFTSAIQGRSWRRATEMNVPNTQQPRLLRRHCWSWLVLQPGAGIQAAMSHALRFHAEAKMLLFLALDGALLALAGSFAALIYCTMGRVDWNWNGPRVHWGWLAAVGVVTCVFGVWAFCARERRRWIQVVVSLDELSNPTDGSNALASRCVALQQQRHGNAVGTSEVAG